MSETPDIVRASLGEIDFDPHALKARYLAERDKRLRDDANEQYVEVTGDFSNYVDDPYVARSEREPAWGGRQTGECAGLLAGEGRGDGP